MSDDATLDEFGDPQGEKLDVTHKQELIQGVAWSEIDSVPQEWTVNNVESDIEILAGNNFSSDQFVDNGGIPLIRIRDLAEDDTTINFDGEYNSKYLVNQQDLLVGMDGEFEPHLWTGTKALLNQRVCKIEPKDKYNKIFFRYGIEKPLFYIQKSIAGTTVKHLSQSNINDLNLPTPPLSEQRKIASVLYNVDQAIQKTEEIIEQIQVVKEGVRQECIPSGVGEHSYTSIRVGPKEINIPNSWEYKSLSDVCQKVTDGTHETPEVLDEGYPLITSEDTVKGEIDFSSNKYISEAEHEKVIQRSKPEHGDILFTHIGKNTGKVAKVDVDFEFSIKNVALFKPNPNQIDSSYLESYLRSSVVRDFVARQLQGGAQDFLSLTELKKMPVLLPPENEQVEIAEIISSVKSLEDSEKATKSQLSRLKTGLMQDLLSGTVRTTDTNIEVPE